MRPAAQWLSFASPKESHQRKGDPTRCVPSLRCGQPAVLGFGGVSLNSRRFASLKQTRAHIRQNLRSSAHPEGNPRDRTSTRAIASLRCARPHLAGASATRCAGWAEQRDGPCGCVAVWLCGCLAVWLFGYPTPCWLRLRRGGCGVSMRVEARMPRYLARRSCLNEAPKARSEFCGAPRNRPDAGRPVAQRRGRRLGVAFSLVTFFLATQKKVTRMPGDSRPPPSTKARGQISARLRQAQPERIGMRPGFDKPRPNRRRHPHQLLRAQPKHRTNPVSLRPSTNPEAQTVFFHGTSRDTCAAATPHASPTPTSALPARRQKTHTTHPLGSSCPRGVLAPCRIRINVHASHPRHRVPLFLHSADDSRISV